MNTSKFADKLEEIMHGLGHYNVSFVHILGQPDIIGMIGQVYPQEPYRINTRLYRNASPQALLGLIRKLVAVATRRTLGRHRFDQLPAIVQLQIMLEESLHPGETAAWYYDDVPVVMPIIDPRRLLPEGKSHLNAYDKLWPIQEQIAKELSFFDRIADNPVIGSTRDKMVEDACSQTETKNLDAINHAIAKGDFDHASRLAFEHVERTGPTLADVLNQRGMLDNVHNGAPTQEEIDAYEEKMFTDEELYRLQRFGDDADAIDKLIDDSKGN